MYMGPVIAARAPAATPLRRAVGVPVLLLAAIVMLPWLAVNALVAGVALGWRGARRLPAVLLAMIDYAGTVALGR